MQRLFVIKPSHLLMLLIVCAHALVMGVLFFISLPTFALIMLLAVLAASMVYYILRDAALRSDSACVALRLEDGQVVLINRKGEESSGNLRTSSVVTPHFVMLNIGLPDQRRGRSLLVLPDSMDADSFRRLRVMLRYGGISVGNPGA